jgi:NDP-sugar pyrophosphorylase family protein
MPTKTQTPTNGIANTLRKESFTVLNLTDLRNLPPEITEARLKTVHHNESTYSLFERHENGGGFRQNTAYVAPTVKIHPSGLVIGNAVVKDEVVVANFSTISGNAEVSEKVVVGRYSTITEDATVSGEIELLGVHIGDKIKVSGTGSIHRANLEHFNSE